MIEPRFLRPDYEQRRFCSIGSAILGAVGVGEATAAIAGPLLTAGIGAGVSAATGNSPLTGALIGGGVGALGAATGLGSSAFGAGADFLGGSGAAGEAFGPGSDAMATALAGAPPDVQALVAANPGTFSPSDIATLSASSPAAQSLGENATSDFASLGAAGSAAKDTATKGGPLGGIFGGAGGVNETSLALGALAAGASALSKPQQYPVANVQSSLDVAKQQNQGPLWNAPLQMNGQKRQVQLPGDYNVYTAGFSPTPNFFSNNQLQFPTLPGQANGGSIGALNGYAHGGPEFSTRNGQHYVQGPGDGQSDDVPAQLSSGEYVLTAHDVAVLGGGSNEAGARKIDKWRTELHRAVGGDKFIPEKAKGALNHLRPEAAR